MNIRPIKNKEIGFLNEMLYEALFVAAGEPKFPRAIIHEPSLSKYVLDWEKDRFDIAFVAEENGELIGAIWGRTFPENDKGYGFVDANTPELSMAVKEGFRNRGTGTRLIGKIIKEYRSIGVKSVSLSVDKKNEAIHLYKRVRFKIVSETDTSAIMLKET